MSGWYLTQARAVRKQADAAKSLAAMTANAQRALLLGSILAVSACKGRSETAPIEKPPEAAPSASQESAALSSAPPVVEGLMALSGEELLRRVRASGAKATLVNAWASWCGPCRREIPMLQAMAENLAPQGVAFVLVSVDEPEERPQAEAFLRDHKITLEGYIAARPLEPFKLALNPRWPGMLPATFLYDAQAKLRYFWGGPAYENEILPVIEGLLAGKNIDGEATFGLAPGRVER